ncbi:hypothetical protein ABKN59_009722 [Abortiporus biennis]
MHRVFLIPEILTFIFSCLELSDPEDLSTQEEDGPNLALYYHLAVTCKTFEKISLPFLWKNQTTLIPLLICLSDCFEEIPRSGENSHDDIGLFLRRQPTAEEWMTLHKYGALIKEISPPTRRFGPLRYFDEDLVNTLIAENFLEPLLPNLSKIDWPIADPRNAHQSLYPIFFSPKLASLSLQSFHQDTHPTQLLQHITDESPYIEALNLTNLERHEVAETFVSSLAHLRSLTMLGGMKPSIWHALAKMTKLRVVKLSLIESQLEPDGDNLDMYKNSSTFTDLGQLLIYTNGQKFISTLFPLYPFPRLQSLEIHGMDLGLTNFTNTVTIVLAAVQRHHLLSTLHLSFLYRNHPDGYPRVTPENFRPLFSFKNMRVLRIEAGIHYYFDDTFVDELAHAWPKLQHLTISCAYEFKSFSIKVTLQGLSSFAKNCPDLESLIFPFRLQDDLLHSAAAAVQDDAASSNSDSNVTTTPDPGPGVSLNLLRIFPITLSPSAIEKTARFLFGIFPCCLHTFLHRPRSRINPPFIFPGVQPVNDDDIFSDWIQVATLMDKWMEECGIVSRKSTSSNRVVANPVYYQARAMY